MGSSKNLGVVKEILWVLCLIGVLLLMTLPFVVTISASMMAAMELTGLVENVSRVEGVVWLSVAIVFFVVFYILPDFCSHRKKA